MQVNRNQPSPTTRENFSIHFRQAMKLHEEGEVAEADTFLTERVEDARARYGQQSLAYADASYDLGLYRLCTGDLVHGIDWLCETSMSNARTANSWRIQASASFQVGCAFNVLQRYAEAEMMLKECLKARAKAFSTNHLEWHSAALELSESLINQGKPEETKKYLPDAMEAFLAVEDVLAFDAITLKCMLDWQLGLAGTEELQLAAEWQEGDVRLFLQRASLRLQTYPFDFQVSIWERITDGFLSFLPDLRLLLKLEALKRTAVVCRQSGQVERAEFHVNRAIALAAHFEDTPEVVYCFLLLAKIFLEMNYFEKAEQTVTEALRHAQSDASLYAESLGSYAKLLAATGRSPMAGSYFQQSLQLFHANNHEYAALVAAVDYAVFLHHSGSFEQAHNMLISLLEPLDELDNAGSLMQRVCSHIQARGMGCVCGCYGDIDSEAIKKQVAAEIDPESRIDDFVESFAIKPDYKVHVELKRVLSEEESELMNRYFKALVARLRQARTAFNETRIAAGIA